MKEYRGLQFDDNGWLVQTQFLDANARIVYASTTEGDDVTANKNQYGRSYYLPSDPVIGPDPTNPIGPVYAHGTLNSAYTAARCIGGAASRKPDWLLFKRGDTFDFSTLVLGKDYPGGKFISHTTGGGPTPNQRRAFGAYGDVATDRPKLANITTGGMLWGKAPTNVYIFSLEILDDSIYGAPLVSLLYGVNMFIEDVRMEGGGFGTNQSSPDSLYAIRRSVAQNAYRLPKPKPDGSFADGHVQGLFIGGGDKNWISESIIDMSGYKESPRKPSTWTGGVTATLTRGEMPAGDFSSEVNGVQPARTWFDRNAYLSTYNELEFEGNIISRGAGGGSVQARVGGNIKNNVFLWNHHALAGGHPQAAREKLQDLTIENNLVLHDDHMAAPGGFGIGISSGTGSNFSQTVKSNIVVHFHRNTVGGLGLLVAGGIGTSPYDLSSENSKVAYIEDNVLLSKTRHIVGLMTKTDGGVDSAFVGKNAFVKLTGDSAWRYVKPSDTEFEIGTANTGGNHYYAPEGWKEFSTTDWKESGKDTESIAYHCLPDLAAVLGWQPNAWEKDIISYMQHVDPSYIPDENVTIDFTAPVENRRANAPTVWSVLKNSDLYGGGAKANLSEEDAKLVARRYHAFITFITRAKDNRKGAWDENYTAHAVNNYFRAQFNKPLVVKSI